MLLPTPPQPPPKFPYCRCRCWCHCCCSWCCISVAIGSSALWLNLVFDYILFPWKFGEIYLLYVEFLFRQCGQSILSGISKNAPQCTMRITCLCVRKQSINAVNVIQPIFSKNYTVVFTNNFASSWSLFLLSIYLGLKFSFFIFYFMFFTDIMARYQLCIIIIIYYYIYQNEKSGITNITDNLYGRVFCVHVCIVQSWSWFWFCGTIDPMWKFSIYIFTCFFFFRSDDPNIWIIWKHIDLAWIFVVGHHLWIFVFTFFWVCYSCQNNNANVSDEIVAVCWLWWWLAS